MNETKHQFFFFESMGLKTSSKRNPPCLYEMMGFADFQGLYT